MCWNITRGQGRVAVSNFGTLNAYKNGPIRFMNDLLPERFNKDYPLVRFAVKPTPFYTSFFLLKGNTLLKILGPKLDPFNREHVVLQSGGLHVGHFWRYSARFWDSMVQS